MGTLWDRYEFSPADIGLFAKWLGWSSRPDHYHNDPGLLERETWFWVAGDAIDAIERSQWGQGHGGEVPILLPEDLPAADGIMVLAEPVRDRLQAAAAAGKAPRMATIEPLLAVRWTARSDYLLVQPVYGLSAKQLAGQDDGRDAHTAAVAAGVAAGTETFEPPEAMLRPGTWRELEAAAQLRQSRLYYAAQAAGIDLGAADGAADLLLDLDRRLGVARLKELMDNPDPFAGLRWVSHRCRDGSPLWLTIPSPSVWQWARRCGVGDIDTTIAAALDAAAAGRRTHDVLPMLGVPPPVPEFASPYPPETIALPDPDTARRLVAQDPLTCSAEAAELARLLMCLWAFAAAPLPAAVPRRVTRRIPKHRRHANSVGGLRMLTLRAPSDTGNADGYRQRPRQHLVRGHWRRQWHPSIEQHRVRWIAPHLRAGDSRDGPALAGPRPVRNVTAAPPAP